MGLAWAIAHSLLTRVIDERLDEQLGNATAILAQGTFPFSPDLIGRLDGLIAARIALLDADGDVGLSTADAEGRAALAMLAGRMPAPGSGDSEFRTLERGASSWRAAIRPLPAGRDDRYRYVVAAAPLAETRAAAREAALLLAAAMLLATVVLAILGGYFTRGITRPVAELAGMADRIAEGRRDVSASVDERHEIGVLGRALNDMAARLAEYEQQLAERSRLAGLGDLAARMAHEVRNPLTAIKMQLELLENRVGDDERTRVASVLAEIRRLELIVESTLSLGGPRASNPVPTDLEALIDALVALLKPSLTHRRIALESHIGAMPHVAVDPDQLKQVLLNLINNAAEAQTDGGRIRISAGLSGGGETIDISVEDAGPGLPENAMEEQPEKPLGLGIGLRICEEIVALHGGRLWREHSDTLGGASFTLRLPVTIMADHG